MSFKNKMSKKNKLFLLSNFLISVISSTIYSYATDKVSNYYYGNKSELSGFIDEELPPAIKANVMLDSSIPAETILYRHQYINMTYYSPVPPSVIKGTKYENSNKSFREWGPWDMDLNREAYKEGANYDLYFIPSSYTYKYVTLKAGAKVYAPKVGSTGADSTVLYGTVKSDTRIKVKSITNYPGGSGLCVYFDLTQVPITRGNDNFTPGVNIGRVPISNSTVTNKEGYAEIFNSNAGANQAVFNNFSYYGVYSDTTDASHENIEPGRWTNPSYAKYGTAGLSGEWNYIGFNSKGEPLTNPYFASESLMFRGNAPLSQYDFRYTPWNPNDSYSGESEVDKSTAYSRFPELTVYDTDSKYNADKREVVRKLFTSGKLNRKFSNIEDDITYMMNRISFRSHPTRESAIMTVQRRGANATRSFMVENKINDIYLHSIIVKDMSGKQVGSYVYNIDTNKYTTSSGWVKGGEKYTVEVYLANANGNTLVSNKTQAQIGMLYNHATVLSTPYGSVSNGQEKEISSKISASKGAKSPAITFTITAPSENEVDFFDVYGYVGFKHSGTDNMNYTNDVGFVRLNINDVNDEGGTQYKNGDLVAKKIELIDSKGNIAYSYTRGDSSPTVNKVLPLNSYTVRFTIVNEGDAVQYRTKEKGYWADSFNWIPGKWGAWKDLNCNISNNFEYTRIGSAVSNNTINSVPRETFKTQGSGVVLNNGTISSKQQFTYTIGNIFIEDPYFECSFKISASSNANSNTTNDSLSVVINPTFDAQISNVRINSTTEYIGDDATTASYVVTYDAKLNTPSYMVGENIYMPIDTSITVGNKTEIKRDLLMVGDNKNISHVITDVPLTSAGSMSATVILNYNQNAYETNYNNNRGVSSTNIIKISNPFNSTVCPVPTTKNSWKSSQTKYTWTATSNEYSTSANVNRKYKKYSVSTSTVSPTHNESFEISKVQFRSKYTKDRKLGVNKDGWIDMINSNESSNAYISAGYGFELRIVTTFKTNVNSVANAPYMAPNALSGTNYSYLTAKDNYNLSNELFVELPGSRTTRKILSTTGYFNTIKGLNVQTKDKSTASQRVIENTYTLNSVNSLGVSNSDKIFIPTGMKDGDYRISIYTPPVTGTPTASASEQSTSKMCDRKEITIKVKGAYTDDLNSHLVS